MKKKYSINRIHLFRMSFSCESVSFMTRQQLAEGYRSAFDRVAYYGGHCVAAGMMIKELRSDLLTASSDELLAITEALEFHEKLFMDFQPKFEFYRSRVLEFKQEIHRRMSSKPIRIRK